MNYLWVIEENDIERVKELINLHQNPFVSNRVATNIEGINLAVNKNSILKAMIMCLLTSQQSSGPDERLIIEASK